MEEGWEISKSQSDDVDFSANQLHEKYRLKNVNTHFYF